jgi:pimeloyl-ACP methyl ester carboxylesterase
MVYAKKFQMFDFGSTERNMQHYNQSTPPVYDLKNVNVPVGLVWAQNDWLADPEDVQYIRNNLPNIVFDDYIEKWNHLDFVWATDAAHPLYMDIIKLLNKFN